MVLASSIFGLAAARVQHTQKHHKNNKQHNTTTTQHITIKTMVSTQCDWCVGFTSTIRVWLKLKLIVESGGIGPAPIAYHRHALFYMSRMYCTCLLRLEPLLVIVNSSIVNNSTVFSPTSWERDLSCLQYFQLVIGNRVFSVRVEKETYHVYNTFYFL